MPSWSLADLAYWDAKIREQIDALGLDCYPQEFELCNHNDMLAYMAYSGIPAHYPHWSYGKAFEKLKTLYDHGLSGLPYEMVINSNPSLAYLMRDNSLCLQILTIAHVYGHNDFFKNNFTFKSTRAEFTISTFKAHAERVRAYMEDPSIGADNVENILDAAHALSLQRRRNLAVKKLSPDDERRELLRNAQAAHDPFRNIHRRPDYVEPDLQKVPLSPEPDILLFIREHNPYLANWERDLLTIVDEEARYFIPQIETKIMNEGWASWVHREILNAIELPQELHLEFLVRHNQVVRPTPGGINPYHLGLKLWTDLKRRCDEPTPEEIHEHGKPEKAGMLKLLEVRETDRDQSFLRRFLTEELMREMDLFEYEPKGDDLIISKVADEQGWRSVKEQLIRSVGMGGVPVIRIEDADFGHKRTLYLMHDHDGRDLQLENGEKTLAYVHRLWGREVVLETVLAGKRTLLTYNDRGFSAKTVK
ncbi:MAG: stage V sporulation protein R [Polyangiaceae bacterium UTPRO1]|nr:SpoVR family protein [Myxococcales bacterium]OQY68154.1 MAG: stage V sporulation protein R [Polyangiaceae bacterium UTPRO1]